MPLVDINGGQCHFGAMHSPHPIIALLQRWAYRLRQLIPRPPILTESHTAAMERMRVEADQNFAERLKIVRAQLEHEYGFRE